LHHSSNSRRRRRREAAEAEWENQKALGFLVRVVWRYSEKWGLSYPRLDPVENVTGNDGSRTCEREHAEAALIRTNLRTDAF
ncbi:MAG TPA: hypothetical protein VHD63_01105, partial [Ktedonobacteraceae bacterium]|nr:hypothetical protein [Ktedonobacteraceae bacterium]